MAEIPDEHLVGLFVDSVAGRLTESGREELMDWVRMSPERQRFYHEFRNPEVARREMEIYTRYDPRKGFERWKKQQSGKKQLIYYIRTASVAMVFGTLALWWLLRSDIRKVTAPARSANNLASMETRALLTAGDNRSDTARTLPDGTKVWLNSQTKILYPAEFSVKERVVELNGEAYFEVAHDPRPFSVKLPGGTLVQALGTRFDVMAYRDEDSIQTTLLEGVVYIEKGRTAVRLEPGQQISAAKDSGGLSAPQEVDGEKLIEWKNNVFYFPEHSNLNTVLRRIARWYHLQLVYEVKVSEEQEYQGEIQRSLPLEKILEQLKHTGIKFTISNGQLIVGPDGFT
jgi:ferric-dicitrate binding protein FerR (iron transport regulator)